MKVDILSYKGRYFEIKSSYKTKNNRFPSGPNALPYKYDLYDIIR